MFDSPSPAHAGAHLQEVPAEVLRKRKAVNPREAPQQAADGDNTSYD